MKKIVAIMIAAVMVCSLAACGATPAAPAGAAPAAAEAAAPAATEAAKEAAAEAAAAPAAADGETIKIGFYSPLTGANANQGIPEQNAIKLRMKNFNAEGGLLGKQLELISYDDASDTEEAVKIATKLVEVDKVDIVIASLISNCVLASANIPNDAQIVTFGTGLSPTWMQQGWEFVFRPCLNSKLSISTMPQFAKDTFGYTKFAVFEGQDDYGVACGVSFRDAAEAAGVEITTTENYAAGDTDFSGQVAKILSSGCECVFLGVLSGEVGPVVKQFRQFGYDGILLYSENMQRDILDVAGDAADHLLFAYPYVLYDSPDEPTNPVIKDFVTQYYNEYGEMPAGDCAYRGWDCMQVIKQGVEKAGTTNGPELRDAILTLNNVPSCGGTFDFTKEGNGECLYDFSRFVIVGGKNVNVEDWIGSDDYNEWLASWQG